MPDLGDLLDFDFGGTSDWADWAGETGAFGFSPEDFGITGEWFLDSETGNLVSGDEMRAITEGADYDFGGLPLSESPISTSKSDILRSMEGAPAGTTAPGREAFDWTQMADPSASIASAGDNGWLKAGLSGLSGLMSGLTGGGGANALKGLSDSGGGGRLPTTGLPGLLSASVPQVGGVGMADIARAAAPGQADLLRAGVAGGGLGMQDPVSAALMRLQADAGPRAAAQGALDVAPIRDKFDPLLVPFAQIDRGSPQAQRLSGLQRLALERMG